MTIRVILILGFLVSVTSNNQAQTPNIDSLFRVIKQLPADSASFDKVLYYSTLISFHDPHKGVEIDQMILARARKLAFRYGEASALMNVGEDYHFMGNFTEALKMQLKAREIFSEDN